MRLFDGDVVGRRAVALTRLSTRPSPRSLEGPIPHQVTGGRLRPPNDLGVR